MKKALKWMIAVLLSPVILFFLLSILLYIPPIQDFAVKKATAYAAEATGMDISMERLRLSFPLDLDLRRVSVSDAREGMRMQVEDVIVDLNLWHLLQGKVDVDALEINGADVNTGTLIEGLAVNGRLKRFFLDAHGVDIPAHRVTVNNVELDEADISILLNDTAATDTASSVVDWQIAVEHVSLSSTRLKIDMPLDSMSVATDIRQALLEGGDLDLERGVYAVRSLSVQADSVRYDRTYEPVVDGLDVNHLSLDGLDLQVDTVRFAQAPLLLSMGLRRLALHEKCGLTVEQFRAGVMMDAQTLHVADLVLETPDSRLQAQADMDFTAVTAGGGGRMTTRLQAELGKQDLMLAAGSLPTGFVKRYPNTPLMLRLSADGNVDRLTVHQAGVELDHAFRLEMDGTLTRLLEEARAADMKIDFRTQNIDFVKWLADERGLPDVALPPMRMQGTAGMKGNAYQADLTLRERQGRVDLQARYDTDRSAYNANLVVDNMQLHDFLPHDSLYLFSAKLEVGGRGFDPLSRHTLMEARAELERLQYDSLDVTGTLLEASLREGVGVVELNSDNEMLNLRSRVDALIARDDVNLTFSIDMRKADWHALRLSPKPFSTSLCMHVDGSTNLKDRHALQGELADLSLILPDTVYRPAALSLDVLMRPDTLYAYVKAGDFLLNASGKGALNGIVTKANAFVEELNRQAAERHIDQNALKALLPEARLHIRSGRHNPLGNMLATQGLQFRDFNLELTADPEIGLNGGGHVYALNTAGILLDTLQWHVFQDSTGVKMDGRVRNGPKNKQFVFDATLNSYILASGAGCHLTYVDGNGRKGVNLGLRADLADDGVRVVFEPLDPIIAYRNFRLNADNYVFLGNDRRVKADVDLLADDGTGVKLYTIPNEDALQDISLSLNRLNLGELTNVLPYAPRITGFLHGDAHLVQTADNMSVMADMTVDDMTYEEAPLGQVGLNAVYLPNEDGSHFVDARVLHYDNDVLLLSGTYTDDKQGGVLDAGVELEAFPLTLANGFVSPGLVSLAGTIDGSLTATGPVDRLHVNGGFGLDSVRVKSAEYSLNLRMGDDSIRIDDSRLLLNKLKIYSLNNNPLLVDGKVDFSRFDDIRFDTHVTARNYELINAPRTQQASAYGKVYVDVDTRMQGTPDNVSIRGQLNVLGNTDVTYVLKDSPLTVEDRLSDLVTFVDFADTTGTAAGKKAAPLNLDMEVRLSIDQAAQVYCILSADQSNYVEIEGGGTLIMSYSPEGDLQLSGRYTVLSGEMKYSLPVIPLKTFTLKSGSYIEFTGDPANPTLNLSASERVRATVTENDVPRTVGFDVGLSITQNLENMGLEFTLDAPEDMTVRNELSAMSSEQRGRLAVTMLATGMYLNENNGGGTGGFSTQNALNSLLQSEINSIAGKALRTIDLSVGMESGTSADGSEQTDYSFRFAKRFWGNRISLIVGGKVSTGDEVENTGQTLIDNVSLEYRLDKSATRYVKIFYDKNHESVLEGELIEMGAGLVLRRKMDKLGELFIFRKKDADNQAVTDEKQ
ncbi:MAG: translocation/assembly module TamB [Clostridium sp.]|nr:translocation/assembly module TamB [Clostridium sp.]